MTRTLAEWQKAAHSLAVEKGFYDCRVCEGSGGAISPCDACENTGRAPMTPTRIGAKLALIHCEISEAVECVARGRMELGWSNARGEFQTNAQCNAMHGEEAATLNKPDGFPIELADVFLRLCDLAESLGLTLKYDFFKRHTYTPLTNPEQIANALAQLHWELGGAGGFKSVSEVMGDSLDLVMHGLHKIAIGTDVDLFAMAELKHEYNKTRPIMHGGKVL